MGIVAALALVLERERDEGAEPLPEQEREEAARPLPDREDDRKAMALLRAISL